MDPFYLTKLSPNAVTKEFKILYYIIISYAQNIRRLPNDPQIS